MLPHEDIRKALITEYQSAVVLPTAYENAQYDPITDVPWCELVFLPAGVENNLGKDVVDGDVMIDVHYPTGTGNGGAMDTVEAIKNAFPVGKEITYGGHTVRVKKFSTVPGSNDGRWFTIRNYVSWYAFA